MIHKPKIVAYTDGACFKNPGPGGWGVYILTSNHTAQMLKGSNVATTNNQMELFGAIKVLETLTVAYEIEIYTDSVYLKSGITEWINKWQKNGWKTTNNQPVKNANLWRRLLIATKDHTINWYWIKGHSHNIGNEIADSLANLGKKQAIEMLDIESLSSSY